MPNEAVESVHGAIFMEGIELMAAQKRVIQGYEVTHAVRLGGIEVILAEDMTKSEPYLVCDCSRNNPFNVEVYDKGIVSADYLEIMQEFTKRLSSQVELLENERNQRGIPIVTLSAADCEIGGKDKDMTNRVVVIKPERMAPEYRSADYQLHICTGGFGALPDASGRAVYCTELFSGDKTRFEKADIAGVMSAERLPDWAREKLAALTTQHELEKTVEKHDSETFTIYQLQRGEKTRHLRFESLESITAAGLAVECSNYEAVYTAQVTTDTDSLDKIFNKFNIGHPEDFKGHSLSISDVVVISSGGQQTAHYVDIAGFTKIQGFIDITPSTQVITQESVLDKLKEDKQNNEPPKQTEKKRKKGEQEI